jgi:RNA polymerase sigma factor (sigma-70 family)
VAARRDVHGVELPPFQQLLDAHARDVHRFLVATVGPHDADDCYQETWISALRGYPRLRDASNLRGWLFTIAHRRALDMIRARRRAPIPVEAVPEAPAAPDPKPLLSADSRLWQTVAALPAKQRTAIALRYVLDADYAFIADSMGTSQDAARRNVHEALKKLRQEDRDAFDA